MRLSSMLSVAVLSLAACGDDGGSSNIDAAPGDDSMTTDGPDIDAAPAMLTLTSTAYTNGGAIPAAQACQQRGGQNQSPPLAWSNVPAGTMSFAIVFTDLDNGLNGLIHSAIYDIPGTATSIPGAVENMYAPASVAGAHTVRAYNNQFGYAGPCPNEAHMYQHKIYALATATVPNSMMSTTRPDLVTELEANNLGTGTLTATFTPP